jgi:hypothetical protein
VPSWRTWRPPGRSSAPRSAAGSSWWPCRRRWRLRRARRRAAAAARAARAAGVAEEEAQAAGSRGRQPPVSRRCHGTCPCRWWMPSCNPNHIMGKLAPGYERQRRKHTGNRLGSCMPFRPNQGARHPPILVVAGALVLGRVAQVVRGPCVAVEHVVGVGTHSHHALVAGGRGLLVVVAGPVRVWFRAVDPRHLCVVHAVEGCGRAGCPLGPDPVVEAAENASIDEVQLHQQLRGRRKGDVLLGGCAQLP